MTVLVHNYRDAVRLISNNALMVVDLTGAAHGDALDQACGVSVELGREAVKRTGSFERVTTADEIEGQEFLALVASDILNGGIVRPSTGNVREAALYRMSLSTDERAALDNR